MRRGVFLLERAASLEERIKRAEEVYQRRRNKDIRMSSDTVNSGKKTNLTIFKKIFLKVMFCTFLYFLLFFIKNNNYIFSNDIINKTNEILSYDMNLQAIYDETSKYLGDWFNNYQNNINQNEENVESL